MLDLYRGAPRYAELLRRLIDPQIELVPQGLILELDRPEWSALKKERLWSHGGNLAALAANFSSIGIRPTGANLLTVVTGVLVVNTQGAAQTYKIGETNALVVDSSTAAAVRDQRNKVAITLLAKRQQVADALASLPPFSVAAGGTLFLPIQWPLTGTVAFPGAPALTLQGAVVNQEVSAYFWGYERGLDPEELVID